MGAALMATRHLLGHSGKAALGPLVSRAGRCLFLLTRSKREGVCGVGWGGFAELRNGTTEALPAAALTLLPLAGLPPVLSGVKGLLSPQ